MSTPHIFILNFGIALVYSLLSIACQPSSQTVARAGKLAETPESKPTSVGAVRVAAASLRELSRIDRGLRPFLGVGSRSDAQDLFQRCRKLADLRDGPSKVKWDCSIELIGNANLGIRGEENLEFDQTKNSLKANSQFEIQHLTDLDSNNKSHTLEIRRSLDVEFENGSTRSAFRARIHQKSLNMKKNLTSLDLGSNWTALLKGVLSYKNGALVLEKGSKIIFQGSLYGDYGERKTLWSSSGFSLEAETDIDLKGLRDGPCLKPNGRWKLEGRGQGETLQTSVESTQFGIFEASGSQLEWSNLMCFEP